MYHYPPPHTRNYGLSFHTEVLTTLQNDIKEWSKFIYYRTTLLTDNLKDIDEFLPSYTLNWCMEQLRTFNFDPIHPPTNTDDVMTPYRTVYLQFRTKVHEYVNNRIQPELELAVRPTGAHNWSPHITAAEVELPNDGPDDNEDDDMAARTTI